eukprot:TRINITY_DN29843_c0_g1_i1.p1 TRINITY_DN29843_c0_g1~~TRINITY_DN29843_c0_g1_i1.p1  ORF type:complete len:173 (-),score=45.67 TRINITY_DN29843_c0_g1_i1:47-565(-)
MGHVRRRRALLSGTLLSFLAFSSTFVAPASPARGTPAARVGPTAEALAGAIAVGLLAGVGSAPAAVAAPEDAQTLDAFLADFKQRQDKAKAEREAREKSPFRKLEEMQEMASLMSDLSTISGKMGDASLKDELFNAADKLSGGATKQDATPAPDAPDKSFEEMFKGVQFKKE